MGKNISMCIGVWLIIKGILNLILGFSAGNLISLILAVVIIYIFNMGIKYSNYVVAVLLAIVVIKNLPYNISHFQVIYLLEAVVDAVCICFLVANKEVKQHFGIM